MARNRLVLGTATLALLLLAGVASILASAKSELSQTHAVVYASDPQSDDNFGASVSLSGDTLAVGAFLEDGGAGDPTLDAGAVYLFERDQGGPGSWGETKILRLFRPDTEDWFGLPVAIDGDTVAVGARKVDGGIGLDPEDAGAVYIFDRHRDGENQWGQVAEIRASDGQGGDIFGSAVALDNDTLVVGARWEDGGLQDPLWLAGSAYVFDRDLGGVDGWGEVAILRPSEHRAHDSFGSAVAISNDTIAIGAIGEDGGEGNPTPDVGAVYIFERNEGGTDAWGEVAVLRASDAQSDDHFGTSLALDGDTLVVAADFEDGGTGDPMSNAGAAYIFERNHGGAGAWGEVVKLTASDAQPDDLFGFSVSLDDDTIIVGAFDEDGGEGGQLPSAGAVYQFERNFGGEENWGERRILRAPDAAAQDNFGVAVSVNGGVAVVGAFFEDGGPGDPVMNAGTAYIYLVGELIFEDGFETGNSSKWSASYPVPTPTPTATPTITATPTPTSTPTGTPTMTPTGTPTVVPTATSPPNRPALIHLHPRPPRRRPEPTLRFQRWTAGW